MPTNPGHQSPGFEHGLRLTRRALFGRAAGGLGGLALASLLEPGLLGAGGGGVLRAPHFAPRAKRAIYLYMAGGPSHLETFDPKPMLARMSGRPMPESFTKGTPLAQLQGARLVCLAPQHRFRRYGRSGLEMAEIFPRLGGVAGELCVVRSVVTDAVNHDPAHTFMNTGTTLSGRPSLGSWLNYGLGSESDDLPGFVVLTSLGKFGQGQPLSSRLWHSGFLPGACQGVEFHAQGDPVHYLGRPRGVDAGRQRDVVDAVQKLDALAADPTDDPEVAARVHAYETAFRMQTSVPELTDLTREPRHVRELYGVEAADGSFAANCLLARRLAERGVRFVQLYHRDWDHHAAIKGDIEGTAREVDRGAAALLTDLRRLGMLDDTLVVWGGEFGRTPMAQGSGRDHHIKGFSVWLAGGGVKPGLAFGATDELGYAAVQDVVHVHDLHATVLHLFGVDHTRLTFRSEGREVRLTDVAGRVVRGILA